MLFISSLALFLQPSYALQRNIQGNIRGQFDDANQFGAPCSQCQLTLPVPVSNINMHDCEHDECRSFLSPVEEGLQYRIGEAANPGPTDERNILRVRTFNPAQLLGNEDVISTWPRGIYTAAETSHTAAAMGVTRARLKKHDVNVLFGHPVDKLNNKPWHLSGSFYGMCDYLCFATPALSKG